MKLLFGGFRSIKAKGKKTNTAALWVACRITHNPWVGKWLTLLFPRNPGFYSKSVVNKNIWMLHGKQLLQDLELASNVFKYKNISGLSQRADGSLQVAVPLFNGPAN